jgi:hypothetical protein
LSNPISNTRHSLVEDSFTGDRERRRGRSVTHRPVEGFTHGARLWQVPSDRQTPRFVTTVESSPQV